MDYEKELQSLLMLDDAAFKLQQNTIDQIVANTTSRLLIKLKGLVKAVPSELDYIILEVAVKRFNRLKNEGMTAYGQEGESISYNTDDFAEFADDIDAWVSANDSKRDKTGVRFISGYGGNS